MLRRSTSLLLVVCVLSVLAGTASARPRVIVLGFDGADDAMTRKLMEEGHLPNLKRLAEISNAIGYVADLASLEKRLAPMSDAERRALADAIERQRSHFISEGRLPEQNAH